MKTTQPCADFFVHIRRRNNMTLVFPSTCVSFQFHGSIILFTLPILMVTFKITFIFREYKWQKMMSLNMTQNINNVIQYKTQLKAKRFFPY